MHARASAFRRASASSFAHSASVDRESLGELRFYGSQAKIQERKSRDCGFMDCHSFLRDCNKIQWRQYL